MNNKTLIWVIIAAVVIVAAIFIVSRLLGPEEPGSVTAERQGIVLAVDRQKQLFPLEISEVLEENGEYLVDVETLTVYWTDETSFYAYENSAQVEDDISQPAGADDLQPATTVRVKGALADDGTMSAREIYILPGSAQGETANTEE